MVSRLHCISGRGLYFLNRDMLWPDSFFKRNMPFTDMYHSILMDMLELWDGTNEKWVYAELARRGAMHSAIDDPANFVLGICSEQEIEAIRAVLSPPEQKVLKCHLMDVVDDGEQVRLKLRGLDGKTVFYQDIPAGSFVINCTDHYPNAATTFEPLQSKSGKVLTPQQV